MKKQPSHAPELLLKAGFSVATELGSPVWPLLSTPCGRGTTRSSWMEATERGREKENELGKEKREKEKRKGERRKPMWQGLRGGGKRENK